MSNTNHTCAPARPLFLAGLVTLLEAVSPAPRARADSPPLRFLLLSHESTNGSFGMTIGGASEDDCVSAARGVQLTPAAELTVMPVRACEFAVTPKVALAPGTYCLRAEGLDVEPGEGGCFEVTGTAADLTEATVALSRLDVPAMTSETSCRKCEARPDVSLCTRAQVEHPMRVELSQLASEAASSHAFAITMASGPAPLSPPAAADENFQLLTSRLTEAVNLAEPPPGQVSCVAVYARPFQGAEKIHLGTDCIEPTEPAVVPKTYVAAKICIDEYKAAWCEDNRSDCASGGASLPEACGAYPEICGGPGGGSVEPGDPSDSTEDWPTGSGPGNEESSAPNAARAKPGGCSALSTDPSGVLAWAVLGLVFYSRRRRQPDGG